MQSKLSTVEDVFPISGRGLIVVPGPPLDCFASPGEVAVLLRRPDGRVLDAIAAIAVEFQAPPPKEHRYTLILKGVEKSDVPVGTEIWFDGDAR